MMKLKYIVFFIFCLGSFSATSQVLEETKIQQELEKIGIDEEELKKCLKDRGYDVDEMDKSDPNKIIEMQTVAEEIIKEMQEEKEKAKQKLKTTNQKETKPDSTKEEILIARDTMKIDVQTKEEKKSSIYGQDIYRKKSVRFYKKSDYINTPSTYILGPGDIVAISIWGRSEANFSEEISSGGFVKFYEIPRISLTGLTVKDAKSLIKSKLSRSFTFNDNEFELKVTSTRNINVSISGEVQNVGSYNMSAVNTAVNALAAAGGPSDNGSVRNIQLVSAENGSKTLDLYKFLKNPLTSQNLYLFEGDYIIVPIAGRVVQIKGAITRPFKYELLPNETLQDLIDFAGGLKVNALKKNVKITRYENDERILLNLDLNNSNSGSFKLKNGDIIEIDVIENTIDNAITVIGALENPGSFAVSEGMKMSDLLRKTKITKDAILDLAYLTRLNDDRKTVRWQTINLQKIIDNPSSIDNIELKDGDKLNIRGKSNYSTKNRIEIKGAVNSEGIFQLDSYDDLKVSDAIFLADGLSSNATDFAYIIRNTPDSTSPEYLPVNIKEILGNTQSAGNITLSPGDVLQIYEKNQYIDDMYVSIEGAVRVPSRFKYDESLTLKDVLLLSKGLTIDAASNKIDVYRLEFNNNNKTRTLVANTSVDRNLNATSASDFELQPFDQVIVRKAPEFELQREVFIDGEVKFPGKYYLLNDNFTIVDLINDAGGLTEEAFKGGMTLKRVQDNIGYIIVDLDEAIDNPDATTNVILQLQDSIYIPKMNNLVTVSGAVNKSNAFNADISNSANRINFVYEKNKKAKYYIEKSGGFKSNADKSSITVRYPNGEMHKTSRFLFFRRYPKVVPGSIISVEYKEEEALGPNGEKEQVDWGSVLSSSVAQATTILSLILLLQSVD